MNKFKNIKNEKIYLVTSSSLSIHPSVKIVENFLRAGGKLFQIREKEMNRKDLIRLCEETKILSIKYNGIFILNDDPSLAKEVDADGVHLGQLDASIEKARDILGKDKIIGVSTHNIEEAVEAQEKGADYINIGPVFKTGTKPDFLPLGINKIKEILKFVNIPFTFMGGIKKDNIGTLLALNPLSVAMITEITKASDPYEKTKELLLVNS